MNCCNALDVEEDRKSAAEDPAQARIAAAPMTASNTAGCRKPSHGARAQGGSRIEPPPDARRGGPWLSRSGAGAVGCCGPEPWAASVTMRERAPPFQTDRFGRSYVIDARRDG